MDGFSGGVAPRAGRPRSQCCGRGRPRSQHGAFWERERLARMQRQAPYSATPNGHARQKTYPFCATSLIKRHSYGFVEVPLAGTSSISKSLGQSLPVTKSRFSLGS
jgi:hypothetical protein